NPDVASVGLTTLGGIVGVVGGVLVATPFVPKYIPDNRALFIMGSMWLGAGEGAALGLLWKQISTLHQTPLPPAENPCPGTGVCCAGTGDQLRAAFVASLPGIAVGLTTGALIADKAPTYGRVSLIQSAALGGMVTGALVQVATQWNPYGDGWRYSL